MIQIYSIMFRYLWNPLELLRFLRLQNWSWACSWSFERSSRADLKDLIDLISCALWSLDRCRNKHIDYTEDTVKDILAQKKTLGSSWIILDHLVPSYTLLIIIVGYIAIIDHCWPSLTIKSINMWIFFMATMGSESCQAVGLTLPQFTEENWVRCAKAISNGLQRAVAKQHLVVKDGQSTW